MFLAYKKSDTWKCLQFYSGDLFVAAKVNIDEGYFPSEVLLPRKYCVIIFLLSDIKIMVLARQ